VSHIANHFSDSFDVIATGRRNIPSGSLSGSLCSFMPCDLANLQQTKRLFQDTKPTHIIHLAAQNPSVHQKIENRQFLTGNIATTFNILEAARSLSIAPKIINISTYEVLSKSPGESAKTPYSASKAAAAAFAKAWRITYQIPTSTLFFANLYGPNQSKDKLIPQAMISGLQGTTFQLFGDGQKKRSWLYVADACSAIIKSLTSPTGEYIITGTKQHSINHVITKIARLLKEREDITLKVSKNPSHFPEYTSLTKYPLPTLPSWKPETGFKEGLAFTFDWLINEQK